MNAPNSACDISEIGFIGVFLASSAYGGRSRGLLFHLQGKTLVPSLEELLIPPGMDIED